MEEYIEGRELYVGVIGNDKLKVLAHLGDDVRPHCLRSLPAIATRKVKWDRSYQKNVTASAPRKRQDLPEGVDQRGSSNSPSEFFARCI